MFRCPACAKVWKIPLTKGYCVLAHKDMTRHWIIKEPISLMSEFTPVKNLEDLMVKSYELGIELDTKGKDYWLECPSCKCHSTFTAWNEAFKHPDEFFNGDQLCACGGELWWDKIPGVSGFAYICEDCGWMKPKAVLNTQVSQSLFAKGLSTGS